MFQVSPALKNFWIDRDSFMVDDTKSSGNWWGRRAETPATGSLQRNEGGSSQIMSSRPSLRPSEPKRFFWYGMMMEGEGFVGTCRPCRRNKHSQRHARAQDLPWRECTYIFWVHYPGPTMATNMSWLWWINSPSGSSVCSSQLRQQK